MSVFSEIVIGYIINRLDATWRKSIEEEKSNTAWEKVGFDMDSQKTLNDTNRKLVDSLKEEILGLPIKDDKAFYANLRELLQTCRSEINYKNVVRPEVLNVDLFVSHLQNAIDLLELIFTRFTELELLVPHDKDPINEFTYAVARYVAKNISLDINPDMMRPSQKKLAKEKEELALNAHHYCLKKIKHLKATDYEKTKQATVIETLETLLKNNREKCDKRAEFSLGFMKVQLPSVQPGYGFLDICMSEALNCIRAPMEKCVMVLEDEFTANTMALSPSKGKEPASHKEDAAVLTSSAAISPEESIKPQHPENHQQGLVSANPSSTFYSPPQLSRKERKELERQQRERSSLPSSAASSNP